MPGDDPASVYPFGNFVLVTLAQISLLFLGDGLTWTQRVVISFAVATAILFMIPFLAAIQQPAGLNFWIIFIVLIPFGAFSGVAQGTVFTMSAQLPFKYIGAVMFGNGLSAIFANFVRFVTLLIFPYNLADPSTKHNAYLGAVVFCTVCSLLMFLTILIQVFVLRKNRFYIFHFDWDAARA